MKKLLTALALLTTLGVVAQRNNFKEGRESLINFGVKGGVNANKISGQSYKNGFNYNFQAGVFVQINFSKKIGLQPEVNFVQTSSSFSEDASDVYDDLFRDGSQKKAKLNYLEVPLLVNINIGPTKKVKLQFGPAYGGLLKQTIDSLKTNANLYKTSDWSAIGGFWIQLPVVNFGARYKLGLSDINAIDDRQTWKNQSLQVFVGVTL
jgi:Outer membrane protein beta-barrel domain